MTDELRHNLLARGYTLVTHEDHDEHRDENCAECRVEMEASYAEHIGSYRAERELRQSLALARQDLDMAGIDEWPELMDAIQARLK
jgi:hypothetical protein